MAHAEAYKDPGTPEEQTRRTFMANAVIAMGGVIGLGHRDPAHHLARPVLRRDERPVVDAHPDAGRGVQEGHRPAGEGHLRRPRDERVFRRDRHRAVRVGREDHRGADASGASRSLRGRGQGAVSGRRDGLRDLQPDLPASRLQIRLEPGPEQIHLPVPRIGVQRARQARGGSRRCAGSIRCRCATIKAKCRSRGSNTSSTRRR